MVSFIIVGFGFPYGKDCNFYDSIAIHRKMIGNNFRRQEIMFKRVFQALSLKIDKFLAKKFIL